MGQERLQKFLAQAGLASRRKAEQLIVSGRVQVGGRTVYQLGTKVDPERALVAVDGKVVTRKKFVYLAFHKPRGVLTTLSDPSGRKTVAPYFAGTKERVYPVGRLDRDSEGLLLVTNDGALAARLMHPRFHVGKEYEVEVEGVLSREDLSALEKGIWLEGRKSQAHLVTVQRTAKGGWVRLVLYEGRKRLIRRMFAHLGKKVIRLKRLRIGPITLGGLSPGTLRPLQPKEIALLTALAVSTKMEQPAHG